MRTQCALCFFADQDPEKSTDIVEGLMQKLLPDADASIAEGDFVYSSGLNAFNNMRYQFMKAIRLAMISYKTSHIRYIISLVLVYFMALLISLSPFYLNK